MGARKGFFLVLVAAVVAALMTILIQFGVEAQLGVLTAGNFRDVVRAREVAKSIIEGAKATVEEEQWRNPNVIAFISKRIMTEGHCEGILSDEEGKLPINQLVLSGEDGLEILQRYWLIRDGSPASLRALIDWIDPDDRTVYGESEASFYGKLGKIPPNRPLQSIYELPTVAFMKREKEKLEKLKERPYEDDMTVWGEGKINLLTANRDVLLSLSEEMTEELVDRILLMREGGRFQTMEDFRRQIPLPPGVYKTLEKWGTLTSETFRVEIRISFRKVRLAVWSVFRRKGGKVETLYYREGLWRSE